MNRQGRNAKRVTLASLLAGLCFGIISPQVLAASVTLTNSNSAPIDQTTACNAALFRRFTVTDDFAVNHIQINLNITHSSRGDVIVALNRNIGGSTTQIRLVQTDSSDTNNNYNVQVDSNSNVPLNDGSDDNTGASPRTVRSFQSLEPLTGISSQGDWDLLICDANTGNGENGSYNSSQLILSNEGPPVLDLDADDSSGATGKSYQNQFDTSIGGPVRAIDTDVQLNTNNAISSAVITLTNRPDGNANELLAIDPTAGGASGVSANYNPSSGELSLTTTNSISPSVFESILGTLTYDNSASSPDLSDRNITVQVTDNIGQPSNVARSTIIFVLENPDRVLACGSSTFEMTSVFILDDSGSIEPGELEIQRQAVLDTLDYFINNRISAQIGIVRFSTTSSTVIEYTDVTLANRPLFEAALNNNYGQAGAGGSTNWQAAFEQAVSLTTGSTNPVVPNTAFFFTDGTQNSGDTLAAEVASRELQAFGTHIYAIGIEDLAGNTSVFERVTDGPQTSLFDAVLDNTETADVVAITDFSRLRDEFGSFISSVCPIPNVLLVKRITAVNGQPINPNDETALDRVVDDTTSPYADTDSNPRWPTDFLTGAINAGAIQPGDDIEYTVYFHNVGAGEAGDVILCDRLQPGLELVLNAYGTNQDVELELGNDPTDSTPNTVLHLTAVNDGRDRTELLPAGQTVPSQCNLQAANDNGTLVIRLTGETGLPALSTLPGSAGVEATTNAYGAFRFVTRVE